MDKTLLRSLLSGVIYGSLMLLANYIWLRKKKLPFWKILLPAVIATVIFILISQLLSYLFPAL